MKNQKLFITSLCLLFMGFFSKTTHAQSIETSIGGLLAYGSEIENLGIGVNAEFGIADNLSISPSFIYYLPKSYGLFKTNWMEFNANANYYFVNDDKFAVYGLGGLNYSSISVKYDREVFGMTGSSSDGRFGLNLGGGANLKLSNDNIIPFAELKYVIIDGGQLVLAAGVRFKI
ncbi:MAG: outer membrane beta-barrel protein [Gelidibacter sp.]